jgi:hypothetical protein
LPGGLSSARIRTMSAETAGAKRLTLVKTRFDRIVQPIEEIHEFEDAIVAHGRWEAVNGLPRFPWFKASARMVAVLGSCLERVLRLLPRRHSGRVYLCVGYLAEHYMVHKSAPHFLLPGAERALWLYDAWERDLEKIASVLRRWRIRWAFVTSRQAAEYFNGLGLPEFSAHWVPEAVTVGVHKCRPFRERRTDILQLGRRWEDYHGRIAPFCRKEGIRYVFEEAPGRIIYPTRSGFLEGLADSKISVCVPSSVTHPERSGRIETMTWRYLQSMASGCLVLGRMPREMRDLFDYEPMLEVDLDRPEEQLRQVLADYDRYIPLIERNLEYVRTHHQWPNRLSNIERAVCQNR